jgi:hypothetical protein
VQSANSKVTVYRQDGFFQREGHEGFEGHEGGDGLALIERFGNMGALWFR